MRWRYAARLAAAAVLFLSILANLARYALLVRDHFYGSDFRLYYAAASTGMYWGWNELYDANKELSALGAIGGPYKPFLNPPPMAWLAVPFVYTSYETAYLIWSAICVAALAASVYLLLPTWRARLLGAAISLALYPTLFALYLGQASILVLLAVAAAWRLHRSGHDLWAGVALGLIAVKPQVALLLPAALLAGGMLKTFAAWLGVTALLAAVSALMLGTHGILQYLDLTSHPLPEDWVYTLGGLLGRGPATTLLQALLAATALAAAWRHRRRKELVFATGLIGSALIAPYWHVQDFLVVIAAASLVLTVGEPRLAAEARLFAAAVFLAANPLWVGAGYRPAWVEVALWLVIEAAAITYLLLPKKRRAPAGTGALAERAG